MPDGVLPAALERLVARAEDPVRARALMLEAITHRTWVNEHPGSTVEDNQRLELLGDAVLELVVTHELFVRLPAADEGLLSRARATSVNETALARAARGIDLGGALRLGRGEVASGGRERARTLADAFEAVVAAAYLAGGLALAKDLLDDALGEAIAEAVQAAGGEAPDKTSVDVRVKDAKSVLQEILQRAGGPPPVYVHREPTGPVHDRTFHAQVLANGRPLGAGDGRSRREAEMRAAGEALGQFARSRGDAESETAPEPSAAGESEPHE